MNIGGTGNGGTISGYDVIEDFDTGMGNSLSETFDTVGTASVVGNGTYGNSFTSSLTINGVPIASHQVTDGIILFDDANTFSGAVTLTSESDLAAAMDYLQQVDLGVLGVSVAFHMGSDSFVFTQGSEDGFDDSLDVLVKLEDTFVDNLITANVAGQFDLFIA